MAHLVTGHAGIEHIKPSDDGAFNIGIFGSGQYVFPIGEQFGYEIISNNLIKIKSGELVNQGRHINIPVNNYEEVTIENGLQGVKRHDIIVMRYEKNPDTNLESASLVVVKGTSSANPSDPVVTQGNIYEGANVSDMPLYRVILDGLNIEKVEKMFTVIPSLPAVNEKAEQNAESIEIINSNLEKSNYCCPVAFKAHGNSAVAFAHIPQNKTNVKMVQCVNYGVADYVNNCTISYDAAKGFVSVICTNTAIIDKLAYATFTWD